LGFPIDANGNQAEVRSQRSTGRLPPTLTNTEETIMLNPNDIVAALAEKLKTIPELVRELDGDPDRVIGCYDEHDEPCVPESK